MAKDFDKNKKTFIDTYFRHKITLFKVLINFTFNKQLESML